MMYEVQTFTLCQGWVNCWSVEIDGISQPETFETEAEAQAAIDEFLAEIQAEIECGDRAEDEGYDRDDYRVVRVAGA